MINSQFDKLVDRKGTNCLKYDFAAEFGRPEGLIPLWVADMDFCVWCLPWQLRFVHFPKKEKVF